MTQHCGLCDKPLPRSQKVRAQVSEDAQAYVHRSCAEVGGYDYEETPGTLPSIEEQIVSLSGDAPVDGEVLMEIRIRSEKMGDKWVFVAENPYERRGTIIAESMQELFGQLAYHTDWVLTESEATA